MWIVLSEAKSIVEHMFESGGSGGGCVEVYVPESKPAQMLIPMAFEAVVAGWPSAAQDYYSGDIDLNEHLIRDRAATFIVRVVGDSMTDAGISHGDELIVDRSLQAKHGDVVIAVLDGELTVKRLEQAHNGVVLRAANPKYPDIKVAELSDLRVWGVVTRCLHHVN